MKRRTDARIRGTFHGRRLQLPELLHTSRAYKLSARAARMAPGGFGRGGQRRGYKEEPEPKVDLRYLRDFWYGLHG